MYTLSMYTLSVYTLSVYTPPPSTSYLCLVARYGKSLCCSTLSTRGVGIVIIYQLLPLELSLLGVSLFFFPSSNILTTSRPQIAGFSTWENHIPEVLNCSEIKRRDYGKSGRKRRLNQAQLLLVVDTFDRLIALRPASSVVLSSLSSSRHFDFHFSYFIVGAIPRRWAVTDPQSWHKVKS